MVVSPLACPRACRSCREPRAPLPRAPAARPYRAPRAPLQRAPRFRLPAARLPHAPASARSPSTRVRPNACCTPSPAPTVTCRSAQWPYRGRAPRAQPAVSWPRSRYRLPSGLALSHNTVYVLRYNGHNLQATSLAIQICLLQYNFSLHSAIQFFFFQYKLFLTTLFGQ